MHRQTPRRQQTLQPVVVVVVVMMVVVMVFFHSPQLIPFIPFVRHSGDLMGEFGETPKG